MPRLELLPSTSKFKREDSDDDLQTKRRKLEADNSEELQSLRRKNFIKACEHASYEAYVNYAKRFNLIYLPSCMSVATCEHNHYLFQIKRIPSYIEESFKIEMKSNMWSEALEVCHLCLLPMRSTHYLTSDILKGIVEIIMNAHEDSTAGHTVKHLIDQSQEILGLHFTTYPPCLIKNIRKCYINFLTSPMDPKEYSFTNRTTFGSDKGIVKYCLNRLEYDLSSESADGPIVDEYDDLPEDMKQTLMGLHWRKEKLELFELLDRTDRIDRIMAVLSSILELLQFDLAIGQSRYTKSLGCSVMTTNRPFMAYVLWSDNVLYTGAVTVTCKQILRIFCCFIHLQYPENHIKTMTNWVSAVIQTFYICENNCNHDYPNIGKYCEAFANDFYHIITEFTRDSIIKILERIQPTYMQYLVGTVYIKNLLHSTEDNLIRILITSMKDSIWTMFPSVHDNIMNKKPINLKNIKPNKFLKLLSKKCKELSVVSQDTNKKNIIYPKLTQPIVSDNETDVVYILYITLQAYLDAYNMQDVQETLDNLNDQLDNQVVRSDIHNSPYSVTEMFVKKYRLIYQLVKELIETLNEIKEQEETPPPVLKMFYDLLGLEG